MAQFFCISDKELRLLRTLRHVEDWQVYAFLRERADFRSGRLEHESALKLTTTRIAAGISLPASQGVAAVVYDRWAVLRSLERLEAAGLVDERERGSRFLRLRLSAVAEFEREREAERNPARNDADSGGKSATRRTRSASSESPSAQDDGWREDSTPAPTFSRNAPESGGKPAREKSDDSSESLVPQGSRQGARSSVNKGVNNRRIKTLSTPRGEPRFPPSAERRNPKPDSSPSAPCRQNPETSEKAGGKGAEATGVERRFRNLLEAEGENCFLHLDSEISRRIYRGWVASGFDNRDVAEAVRRVMKAGWMPFDASSVDKVMRDIVKPADAGTHATRKPLTWL